MGQRDMGQRDRTTDARQASPFALLVEDADTPPPPAKNRGEPGAASRTSTADTPTGAAPAATSPSDRATSPSDRAAPASPPKQDDGAANTTTVVADAAIATASETPPTIAIPKIAKPDGEQDPETTDPVDGTTTTSGDANATPATTQTSQPQPSVTPAVPTAPVTPAVVIPGQTVLAAPAVQNNDNGDDTATGPIKAAPTPTLMVPAGEPQPTDAPVAGPQQAGTPKKEKAATAAGTNTEPPASDDVPAADGKDAKADDGGKTAAPPSAEPTRSDTTHPVQDHARPRNRADIQKPDDLFAQPLDTPASQSAHGAKPPSEAMHAALQAAEGLASASGQTATAPATSPTTLDPAVPIAGLAVEIAARAQAGRNRFDIRLDPPELGRIDVRLDVDKSGQITSRLVVDRPETLEHLRRDASELQRALQQAGLKTSDNGLQFSLRDQSGGFAGRDNGRAPTAPTRLIVPDANATPIDALQARYGRTVRVGGLDISV